MGDGRPHTRSVARASLMFGCWNCSGLSESVPYIREFLGRSPGILVLSEHWLWLYALGRLSMLQLEKLMIG